MLLLLLLQLLLLLYTTHRGTADQLSQCCLVCHRVRTAVVGTANIAMPPAANHCYSDAFCT
jgi:hypothetical protein